MTIAADAKANGDLVLPVTGGARELAVAPSGKEVAFVFRGDVFVASVEGGVTKRITNTPATETGVRFSPDGKALVYASERDGRWAIYEARRTRDAEPHFYASTVVREIAAHRQRAPELPAAVLAGRQGARVHRGPQHAARADARDKAGAHPARRALDLRQHADHRFLEPRRQVDAL